MQECQKKVWLAPGVRKSRVSTTSNDIVVLFDKYILPSLAFVHRLGKDVKFPTYGAKGLPEEISVSDRSSMGKLMKECVTG